MTQEQKDLLLKDLCTRLPYGVKCKTLTQDINSNEIVYEDKEELTIYRVRRLGNEYMTVIPYLFPLSSMTHEQKEELKEILPTLTWSINIGNDSGDILIYEDTPNIYMCDLLNYINWCYKNHFDVHGLIPLDLAIDATGLNIY